MSLFFPGLRRALEWSRARWRRLTLLFVGVLLPLWLFERLADEVREKEGFFFDAPILEWLHRHATPTWDVIALAVTHAGLYGTFAVDVALVIILFVRRQFRRALFVISTLGGSAALNLIVKKTFARVRPALWPSLAPEKTFSFPSGHAMASMSLAVVAVVLLWHHRGRVAVFIGAALFAVAVGLSRLYLGVHFPSDILAAWAASLVWGLGLTLLYRPAESARRDHVQG